MLNIERIGELPVNAGHAMKHLISSALVEWHTHLDEKERVKHYQVYQNAFDRVKVYRFSDEKAVLPKLGPEKSKNIMAIIRFFTDIQQEALASDSDPEGTDTEVKGVLLQRLINQGRVLISGSAEFPEDHRMTLLENWESFQFAVHAGGGSYRGPGLPEGKEEIGELLECQGFSKDAGESDRKKIQRIINTLRDILVARFSIREDHRALLLNRLENIQKALHGDKSLSDDRRNRRESKFARWINEFF